MSRRAFTLIELLVAMGIGMLLVATVWGVFGKIVHATRRSQAITALHLEASAISQAIDQSMSTMFHGAAVHLTYRPRSGAGSDAGVDLDFMSGDRTWNRLSFRTGNGGSGPPKLTLASEEEWYRVKATMPKNYSYPPGSYGPYGGRQMDTGAPDGGSYVVWTAGDDIVAKQATPANSGDRSVSVNMWLSPDVRRDRRRDMNDNDQRLMRNVPQGFLDTMTSWDGRTIGDGSRLSARPLLLSTRVSRFRIELVDARGYRTTACATADAYGGTTTPGITYADSAGSALTPPSPSAAITSPNFVNVWTAERRSVDGIWSDGRNAPCSLADGADPLYADYGGGRLPAPAIERPLIVRVAFTLNQAETSASIPAISPIDGQYLDAIEFDKRRPNGNTYISRDFTFSFACSPVAPKL